MTSDRQPEDGLGKAARAAAEAALAVTGVHALHAGSYGEVATYLPGRRVAGVRVRAEGTRVHLVAVAGTDLHRMADDVRRAVAGVAPEPVEVVVEDVAEHPTADAAPDDPGGAHPHPPHPEEQRP